MIVTSTMTAVPSQIPPTVNLSHHRFHQFNITISASTISITNSRSGIIIVTTTTIIILIIITMILTISAYRLTYYQLRVHC